MPRVRVGVLRGGPSSEYEVSLKTGSSVLKNLSDKYEPIDVLIDRSGTWHKGGLPTSPDRLKRGVDVVFNALHGEYGEDGQVQKILDNLHIPYTGSGHYPSVMAINKHLAKEYLKKQGIKTPWHLVIKSEEDPEIVANSIFNKISPPWIVKPASRGSSVGLVLAKHFSELVEAIRLNQTLSDLVLVEEYILGKEATCGVVDNFRNHQVYALPPIEIRPPKDRKLFDYEAKYSGITEEVCPGCFSEEVKREIEDTARIIHQALGLRHYSRSDFIISNRGIYFLEANSLPGLTTESLLPKALQAVGTSYGQFLDHVLNLALSGK